MAIVAASPSAAASTQTGIMPGASANPSTLRDSLAGTQIQAKPNEFPSPSYSNLANVESNRRGAPKMQRLNDEFPAGEVAQATTNENSDASPGQQELLRSFTEAHKLAHRPRAHLSRTKTDFDSSQPDASPTSPMATSISETAIGGFRHGWEAQNTSSEYLGKLTQVGPLSHNNSKLSQLTSPFLSNTTCILQTNDMRLEVSQGQSLNVNPQISGGRKIARRLFRQL